MLRTSLELALACFKLLLMTSVLSLSAMSTSRNRASLCTHMEQHYYSHAAHCPHDPAHLRIAKVKASTASDLTQGSARGLKQAVKQCTAFEDTNFQSVVLLHRAFAGVISTDCRPNIGKEHRLYRQRGPESGIWSSGLKSNE